MRKENKQFVTYSTEKGYVAKPTGDAVTVSNYNYEYADNNCMNKDNDCDRKENVNHPSHYTWLKELCGIEVIDIVRHLDFDKGNAIKYILRSGYKGENGYTAKEKEIEDIKKAIWYLNDKIKTIEES